MSKRPRREGGAVVAPGTSKKQTLRDWLTGGKPTTGQNSQDKESGAQSGGTSRTNPGSK